MSRIKSTLDALDRPALVTFISAGDPDHDTSFEILNALPQAGADIIELGMPFTDPMADGPVIQQANIRALKNGANMQETLKLVQKFRESNTHTPIVLMGYANPVFAYGIEIFAKDCAAAGVDGLIIVDMPPEEAQDLSRACTENDLDLIRLVTPTTDMDRLKTILQGASGFLYYVSITGVTGAAKANIDAIRPHIADIRGQTDLPVMVGFGIKTPEDAQTMAGVADGIVVGSALVQTIADAPDRATFSTEISAKVKALQSALPTKRSAA